ncbi:Hsp70 family protein [Aggregicoccus sp. 17bor-14]|uniref:Hsp70 family protein n=1 Tax=Myxococcaceae TaxID=31 RepID=UPI00129D20FD|nr:MULTISPECIES: Hsp70 family protein [Myxococcaceae]MBF5041890.1 Hsp70 family protein [Simulacricoccus sp. 17bor-14]MRI87671.1 Hsp70 family protein [Aggregicoccus sp. 17bor-14]
MSSRPLFLGIDLGTTNSTAAVFDGEEVTLVRNALGTALTPSVVRIDAAGRTTVGHKARRLLETDPANTRSEFKRLMGTSQALEFPAAKLTRRPEELAAEVLRSLRADVQQQLGVAPERAVISVPALFELPQSAATSEAARLAGFERVELIQEPVASAIAAGWRAGEDVGAWLVYDLGGGTFDASLLETREGLLRVVGHDGDNFLGGRDFDWSLVDRLLAELEAQQGVRISRADPAHAAALRQLKLAVEEAKIELSRAPEVPLLLPGLFRTGSGAVDLDTVLTREAVREACTPLVDRSVAVCLRLLKAHGLEPSQVSRLVLVGGPTQAPFVRERLAELLGVPFQEQLDPMTLVGQGAALYAGTAGLDARPAPKEAETGRALWLQYPAMTADPTPYVLGRLAEATGGAAPATVQLAREDGGWTSPPLPLSAEGAFAAPVELRVRQRSTFLVTGTGARGEPVALRPSRFSIVHGLTLSDPPLSRTLGVALADDRVRVYFERGTPLPSRRTFRHHTVQAVAKGAAGALVRIPIIQGEYELAHLCREVGVLEVRGDKLGATLSAGSPVELTLELDRGGRLSARALLPATGQVFEEVARLLVPDADPEALAELARGLRTRLARARQAAFRSAAAPTLALLASADEQLLDAERDAAAASGGDADAGQKARRTLLELEAALDALEAERMWPELEAEARADVAWCIDWVSSFGTPEEQQLLRDTVTAFERARTARQVAELQRQRRAVVRLGNAAFFRHPKAWEWMFEDAASRADDATDLPRAQALVSAGREALARKDAGRLRDVVGELRSLLPVDAQSQQLAHRSGLR